MRAMAARAWCGVAGGLGGRGVGGEMERCVVGIYIEMERCEKCVGVICENREAQGVYGKKGGGWKDSPVV